MTHTKSKRAASFLLALVMLFTLMPEITPSAKAAVDSEDFSVSGLTLSSSSTLFYTDSGEWVAEGTSVTGSVAVLTGYVAKHTKLTIKNTSGSTAYLIFNYTTTYKNGDGTTKIADNSVSSTGSYSTQLNNNKSITVEITTAKDKDAAAHIEINNIVLIKLATPTVTFMTASDGNYSVNNNLITTDTTLTQQSNSPYNLSATPNSGYKFAYWYNATNDKYISNKQTDSIYIAENCTVTAVFVPISTPVFEVDEQLFQDLGSATSYASTNGKSKITLIANGTITGNYTIPNDVTLLIPFNSDAVMYKETPGCADVSGTIFRDGYVATYVQPTAYKTLTMASNSSITVESGGAISVSSKHSSQAIGKNQPGGGAVIGQYGHIAMNDNSNIFVENGGYLYCWGYITGNGVVEAKNGATVYEYLQIRDFRGGSATTDLASKMQGTGFLFCQYYVQNIEAALKINAGANEVMYTALWAMNKVNSSSAKFIGGKDSSALFELEDGYIVKKYTPKTDRLSVEVHGKISISKIIVTVYEVDVDSSKYVLPITNSIDINLKAGSTTTISNDMNFLPGSSLTVDEGATLTIASGKKVFFYDKEQWGSNYSYDSEILPVKYSPTRTNTRTWGNTKDAKLVVNGRVVAEGNIYVANGAANIKSEQTKCDETNGTIYFKSGQSGTATTAQIAGTGLAEITANSAVLQNEDGTTTDTNGAQQGNTFYYYKGKWVNGKMVHVTYINPKDGSTLGTEDVMGVYGSNKYNLTINKTTQPYTDSEDREWTHKGWTIDKSGEQTESEKANPNVFSIKPNNDAGTSYPDNLTLYAVWGRDSYNLTINVGNGGTATNNTTLTMPASSTKEQVINKLNETPGKYYTCQDGYGFDDIELPSGYETVTTDMTVTIKFKLKTYSVTVDGVDKGTVQHGKTWSGIDKYQYSNTSDKTYEYSFTIVTGVTGQYVGGGAVSATLSDDKYVVNNVTGNLTLTTTKLTGKLLILDNTQFQACPQGENLIVLAVDGDNAGATVYKYGNEAFYWSNDYKAYVMFADAKLTAEQILKGITTGTGDVVWVYGEGDIFGDVSCNGAVTSLDAGIINDILHGHNSPAITDLMRLRMDVANNGADGVKVNDWYIGISTLDIQKILQIAVGITA